MSSIYLALDGDFCEPTRNNANEIISKAIKWALIERKNVSTYLSKYKYKEQRTKFLLMLSWASIIHKVQGLNLNAVVVSFDSEKQKSFNQGQMHMDLSRVTSINKLYLTGQYNANAI